MEGDGRRETDLAVIIRQLLGADDAVQIGLHELLDDCVVVEQTR